MPGYFDGALPPDASSDLGFTVVSQTVELTVDFAAKTITGSTELVIQPTTKDLRAVRLNCRQSRITRATIEGRNAAVTYDDPYEKLKVRGKTNVHQHEYLRSRLEAHVRINPEPELSLAIPSRVHIQELQNDSISSLSKPNAEDGDTPTTSHAQDMVAKYASLHVTVDFQIKSFRDGIHFVGFADDDNRYPHLYTMNSMGPGSICSVFPCVDDATMRCTWDLIIRCPKTLGDAFRKPGRGAGKPNGDAHSITADGDTVMTGTDHRKEAKREEYLISLNEEESALDLTVLCSGDMTDEIVDPQDPTWKTVSFHQETAVCARHIGFAIGPFEHVDLTEFREVEEDDKLGQNATKVDGYCLPGRADELRNSCMPMAKCMDYFTVIFGTFPFPYYRLLFVDDLVPDVAHTASLSICSTRLLFPEDIIEPLHEHTKTLVHGLASQYVGVSIIPRDATDMWCITGISGFMVDIFMKLLAGNNEYRFRQKLMSEKVYNLDFERYSIHQLGAQLDIDPSEYEFLSMKSALVLFILDRRLAKASGSAGMSRIIARLILNNRTGDLQNGEITTDFFYRLCEKMGHQKLDAFFRQWVYGAGCPIFHVSQRFNKKKLVVEMMITQKQLERKEKPKLEPQNFMREIKEQVSEAWAPGTTPVFTGPMTIRIHEADGTPYEHIVEIKEAVTKIEIPYNTKYKRLKRSKRAKERAMASGIDVVGEAENDVLLYCLGDVLQSEEEVKDWRLTDWTKEDEDRMGQESYEWIRMDADFEWIGKIQLIMPVYMYVSQLQQDRDVVAQYESLQYVAAQYPHPIMSTILIRTLMDRRYFHGIRTLAAVGLARCAIDDDNLKNVGQFHLEKAFQEFFCLPDSSMPRPNDFSDRASYLVQKYIPIAMSRIRDSKGQVPMSVRKFFVDKLRFNDNSSNEFSDCHYVATLMECLADSLVASHRAPPQRSFNMDAMDEDDEDDRLDEEREAEAFQKEALAELERYRRIDEWIASYQNVYSVTAINCMQKMLQAGVIKDRISDILQYTRLGNSDDVRLKAFGSLVELKIGKRPQMLQYMLHNLSEDPSPFFRDRMLIVVGQALGSVAIAEEEPVKKAAPVADSGLILEAEEPVAVPLTDVADKSPPEVALVALKTALADDDIFKESLWSAVQSGLLTMYEVVSLLDIAGLIYDAATQLIATLRMPRFWRVKNLGKGKLNFAETDRIRTAPVNGIGLDTWQLLQQYNLKYTGKVSRAVVNYEKEIRAQAKAQKAQEADLKAQMLAVQQRLEMEQAKKAALPIPPKAPTAMSPPPLPVSTGERPKINLKRKPSSTPAEGRASSPKRQQMENGNATPKVQRSPSISKQRAPTPASRAPLATPSSTIPKQKKAESKPRLIVRLSTRGISGKVREILSKRPKNKISKSSHNKGATPAKSATVSGSGTPAPAALPSPASASLPPASGDFFSSPAVVSSLQASNVGTFRSWSGFSASPALGQIKNEDSAPPSAISPLTTSFLPKRETDIKQEGGSARGSGSGANSKAGSTAPESRAGSTGVNGASSNHAGTAAAAPGGEKKKIKLKLGGKKSS